MTLIDLTHTMSPGMPVYPGTEQPVFDPGCTIEADGFMETKLSLYSHTGTHIDAPAHLLEGEKSLEQIDIGHFHGDAFLIDFEQTLKQTIDVDDIKEYHTDIRTADFLLIHTGWSRYWGKEQYFSGFPAFTEEAARWLCRYNLKGLGLDTISADRADTKEYAIHKTLLKNNMIIIENLTRLTTVGSNRFKFSCFPLKYENSDGSPVRAVAYLN